MHVFCHHRTELAQYCIRHTSDITSYCSLAFSIGIYTRDIKQQPSELNCKTSFTDKYTTHEIIRVSSKQNPASSFRDSLRVVKHENRESLVCLFLVVSRNKLRKFQGDKTGSGSCQVTRWNHLRTNTNKNFKLWKIWCPKVSQDSHSVFCVITKCVLVGGY